MIQRIVSTNNKCHASSNRCLTSSNKETIRIKIKLNSKIQGKIQDAQEA